MKVGVIGCGLVGLKRARALGDAELVACADVVKERAEALARAVPGAPQALGDWRALVQRPDVDLVLVATPHNLLAEIALAAVSAGKHVLVEKPAARRAEELGAVIDGASRAQVLVRVGFNHRYHPALSRAKQLAVEGAIGDLLYVRGRYGHGGRVGYETEWRAQPAVSGGGELVDQGVHLIDLARWFLGDFEEVQGFAHTYYWDMPVEDNGFLLLKTASRQAAFLHASWTEWKNLFSFEIFGRQGKLEITGLGGSYGTERLAHYRMRPEMGPPETTIWEYPTADGSWAAEFAEFVDDIRLGRPPGAGLADARAALRIIERIYGEGRR
ncbi:MAG TPA: Gfo/Idh/MocA family oxidoreductase [Methylomirabilota bacterium]|jgi:predicted dehydrogenase|nr:Gfo/Idh/MocA family oxidoreductase [Methylomirabilota bacterium]